MSSGDTMTYISTVGSSYLYFGCNGENNPKKKSGKDFVEPTRKTWNNRKNN
jgi:hypothetical protein